MSPRNRRRSYSVDERYTCLTLQLLCHNPGTLFTRKLTKSLPPSLENTRRTYRNSRRFSGTLFPNSFANFFDTVTKFLGKRSATSLSHSIFRAAYSEHHSEEGCKSIASLTRRTIPVEYSNTTSNLLVPAPTLPQI